MEQPSFSMKTGRGGVVGHLDVGSECHKLLECMKFSAVRVRRRHNAERLSVPAMTSKCFEKRTNAAPPDKRHDDVNRVRRMDLRANLMPQGWFPARVRQECGVEKRRQRGLERVRGAIGVTPQDGRQHASRLKGQIEVSVDCTADLREQIN